MERATEFAVKELTKCFEGVPVPKLTLTEVGEESSIVNWRKLCSSNFWFLR